MICALTDNDSRRQAPNGHIEPATVAGGTRSSGAGSTLDRGTATASPDGLKSSATTGR